MRSPPSTSTLQPLSEATAPTNQQEAEDDGVQATDNTQRTIEKAESEEEQQEARPVIFTTLSPNRPTTEPRIKRSGSRQQLLERTRSRIRHSAPDASSLPTGTSNFAEEIESEATEIRTLIARTAQLWSAVDRVERVEELPPTQFRRFSTSALHTTLPTPSVCEDDSTSGSEIEEDNDERETESVPQLTLQSTAQDGDPNEALARAASSELEQTRSEDQGSHTDSGHESEDSADERDEIDQSGEDFQLEQGEIMDASNRAINASKARAIQSAMEGNLLRLGFREGITRAALEAGVLEIDHYDSDCELAYVDIFMSLVKMVCDAHVDVLNEGEDFGQNWPAGGSSANEQALDADATYTLERRSFLPFKWPVFDMAQFEFGNARSGTCFNSVCVLTNLPKVSMDRTEELMEILSCNLFCMIGDPIQVVIPSANSTGRTKGHAFLEFDDPEMAKRCALAVDGLTWGRGPFGRIRGNLFRQYQVKSPAEEQRQAQSVTVEGASLPHSLSGPVSVFFQDEPLGLPFERQGSRRAERFRPEQERTVAQQQDIFCDSDEDSSDTGEWITSRPLEYTQFNPSPLLDLSSGSVDIREQFEQVHPDGVPMQLGWDETLEDGYAMQMSSEGEDDDEDESFSSSTLELQTPDEEKLMDQSLLDELARTYNSRCSPTRVSLSSGEAQAASSTVTSTASGGVRERLVDCGMTEQTWDEDGVEKPWRRYCEDLIIRNREMQEQMAFARRRIVQLSHNNQKLHLLIDRVERDRDGLLFENDLLQTQLNGYEDHEMHHDSLMKELVMLRKRLNQIENPFDFRALGLQQHSEEVPSRPPAFSGSFHNIQAALSNLSPIALSSCKMDHLKDWEHLLETTLSRVRSAKEEKAVEMQKKLDRQVEEQNELKLCVICLANEKTILCLPCRHLCLCQACSSREEVAKCPICRLEIEEMLAVYS
ncbi:RING finger protein B [Phytophthora citrophthora]|uniref:RING finger protein B n=1 Tax=Phytophthora citrophthora TaxID=4793 RepID=A0AAD9GVA1_9STRA|nr:RING finger protein B [Phytophthora citrophthora]